MLSPGFSASLMSEMKCGSALQMPEKSTLPSAVRGVGLVLAGWPAANTDARTAKAITTAKRLLIVGYSLSADEAPNTLVPSAKVTDLALAIFDPSFASDAFTVI